MNEPNRGKVWSAAAIEVGVRVASELSSWTWLGVIVLGGVLVTVGNIGYSSARDREKRDRAAQKVEETLRAEVLANSKAIPAFRRMAEADQVPTDKLGVTAWQTVVGTELLLGLEDERLKSYLTAYDLTLTANSNLERLESLLIGPSAALLSAADVRKQICKGLVPLYDRLLQSYAAITGESKITELDPPALPGAGTEGG